MRDIHPDETLTQEDREAKEIRFRELCLIISGLKLGTYDEQAQKDVVEFYELRKQLKGY